MLIFYQAHGIASKAIPTFAHHVVYLHYIVLLEENSTASTHQILLERILKLITVMCFRYFSRVCRVFEQQVLVCRM